MNRNGELMMTNKSHLQIENKEVLHNQVCSILRSAILKGDFQPGERLVQTDLAELIGVSRMPIREALRTLELEGLVIQEPHKGAVVRSLDKEDISEIYELRAILEPLALKKSMLHFTEKDRRELKKYHNLMLESEIEEEYTELNRKFHLLLLKDCNSPRLFSFIQTISHGFAQDTPQVIPGQIEKSNQEHGEILQAILENDENLASEELAKHIARTGEELLVYLF